jgi:sugar/nucleoside kinase (ribokinase family)/fructoselysine-6-P-deglycase FrlB-like protein
MKILGTGLISVDNLFVVKKDSTSKESSNVSERFPSENPPSRYIGSHGGGSVGNTLCILSKFGFESSILGAIGKDPGAELVNSEFKEFGVRSELIGYKEKDTRQFTHLIYPNSHIFNSVCPVCRKKFHHAPILDENDVFSKNDVLRDIYDTDILHVDRANKITLKVVDSAYQRKKIISFDFGNQASWGNFELASEIIKRTTILKTSKGASRVFLSRIGKQSFHELNPNLLICVTTLGDEGARISYRSPTGLKSMTLQPYNPRPLVDRGGAGDAFHAGLLHGLRDIIPRHLDAIESDSAIRSALEFAQGLGGLACTDYGARGYFLKKLREGNFESAVMSDFKKLVSADYVGFPEDPDFLFAKERSKLLSSQTCGVCQRPFLGPEPSTLYEEKIDSAVWPMSSSFLGAVQSVATLSPDGGQRVYFIGSGGSFSVASYGALFLNQYTACLGIASTPYEYVSLSRPDSSAVFISFGGENRDILSALEKAVDMNTEEIHVITGDDRSALARKAKQVGAHVHQVSSKVTDSGFVSSAGMLACISTLLGVLTKSFESSGSEASQFFSLQALSDTFQRAKREIMISFQEFSDTLDRDQPMHFVALGSGWAWPAVIDFEAKMTEGAVCTTEVSELKNFTHGRYLNAYRNKSSRFFVIFGLPSDWKLVRFLKEKLSKDFPVLVASSNLEQPLGTLELMIKALYLSSEVSKKLGLDIARVVRFPKESRGLFSWGPIFSPSLKMDQFVKQTTRNETGPKHQTKLI